MKSSNPYTNLPPHHFWKSGVVDADPAKLQSLYRKKFSIYPTDTIAAAGSCFAQRISHHLKLHNYRVAAYAPTPC